MTSNLPRVFVALFASLMLAQPLLVRHSAASEAAMPGDASPREWALGLVPDSAVLPTPGKREHILGNTPLRDPSRLRNMLVAEFSTSDVLLFSGVVSPRGLGRWGRLGYSIIEQLWPLSEHEQRALLKRFFAYARLHGSREVLRYIMVDAGAPIGTQAGRQIDADAHRFVQKLVREVLTRNEQQPPLTPGSRAPSQPFAMARATTHLNINANFARPPL